MAESETIDLRYLANEKHFLEQVFSVLGKYFPDRLAFDRYYNDIQLDEKRNLFLRIGSFYRYLVKDGSFTFGEPKLDYGMGYINESYKYMAIFSLIEALYGKQDHLDFYQFMTRKRTGLKYPIESREELDLLYDEYKKEFGAIKSAVTFFENLDDEASKLLCKKLRIKDKETSVKELSSLLYTMRSEFVHAAKFVLSFGKIITGSSVGKKFVINDLNLEDLEYIFENGFLCHFRKNT